jgi:uncharacterized protein
MNFTKETAFFLFRIVLPVTILCIQFVLHRRLIRWVQERYPHKHWTQPFASAPFVLFNGALLAVLIMRPRTLEFPQWFMLGGVFPFFIWQAATLFIGLVIFLLAIVKFPFQAMLRIAKAVPFAREKLAAIQSHQSFEHFDASRRVFLRRSMYGLTAVSFAGTAYGLIHEKTAHDLTSAEFGIRNLPQEMDGLTIALISDIHSSIFMTKPEMDKYVQLTNSLEADLIVVPGDFVNSQTEEVYPFAEAFSNLKAPYGVYGVMGNHDFYAPNAELVAKEVDACGVKLLRNEQVVIQKKGGSLCLLGIDDVGRPQRATDMIEEAMGTTRNGMPKILLCHRPYFLPQAAEKSIDLVLSGHTHGGQIVLGQFGDTVIAPASLASPYVWGKYRMGETHMYVSRGIGTVGLPIRINCPPEITKITLRRL